MGTPLLWVGFNLFVLLAIVLDLGVFHRTSHKIKMREAAIWSAVWVGLSLLFALYVWRGYGEQRGLEYLTGYVIEKSLSIDNLFVFLVIFRTFQVDERVQHRVLAWGILGALVMRGTMIGAGVALISHFQWILQALGAFLVVAAIHMLWKRNKPVQYEKNPMVLFANKHLKVTRNYDGESFFTPENGKWRATPLLLVLLVVEISDVAFATDSIPAIFGITRDPFIIYSSNVFAILGLRALYFLLADLLQYFRYLTIGLAMVLAFIGVKMLIEPWWHMPVGLSLVCVGAILLITMALSVWAGPKEIVTGQSQAGNNA